MHEELKKESLTKLNWDAKESICKQWRSSGLSMTKFCAQKKLAPATFSGWCPRLWPKHESKLSPIQIIPPYSQSESTSKSLVIELSFAGTVTARIEATNNQLGFLLRELLHATTTIR